MKISYNLLQSYLGINESPQVVADLLTASGLEVSAVEPFETVPGGLAGLVIGEVLTCAKHPNADKLSVTTVNVGKDVPLHIVCGAPNVAAGQKVVVATVGAVLYPIEGESFKIKESKIRGELSQGMICAEDEIGLGKSHDGIMVLPAHLKPGSSAAEWFKVESDSILEVELTPNRVDAASHVGVARDLRAILIGSGKNLPPLCLPALNEEIFSNPSPGKSIAVHVKEPDACPRYCGLTLSNLHVTESPEWLKNKLRSIGQKPINNVVDVTNFVLHELGQPLHAFDADKIEGDTVIVGTCKQDSPFTTLDGTQRKLADSDLMICNSQNPMCIAGVFGGLNSGVTANTKTVFLESAYFNPVWVRKTAKRHGLSTDASFRYERGADPNITIYALKRAAQLILEVAGGEVTSQITDTNPAGVAPFQVNYNLESASRLIGKSIPKDDVIRILEALEIRVDGEAGDQLNLLVPPFKVDVKREVDVVEEVLRIHGYNQIEIPSSVKSAMAFGVKPDKERLRNSIADMLCGSGFTEMMANSLTNSRHYKDSQVWSEEETVKILNPVSSDLDVLRRTLLFSALEAVAHNLNHRNMDLRLFEYGTVYALKKDGGFDERRILSVVITGSNGPESWKNKSSNSDGYTIKGIFLTILNKLGLGDSALELKELNRSDFNYGMEAVIRKMNVGRFGEISSQILKKMEIRQPVYYAELEWDVVLDLFKTVRVKYAPLPKFPSVRRDLALILDESVAYGDLAAMAKACDRKLIREVNLFDVYKGKGIDQGKKSYALSFVLRDDNQTLTDEKVDAVMSNILKQFTEKAGAVLRQ